MRTKAIVVETRASPDAFQQAEKVSRDGTSSGAGSAAALGQETAQVEPAPHHVLVFRGLPGSAGRAARPACHPAPGCRSGRAAADRVDVQLLLLVGDDVHGLAGLAQAEAPMVLARIRSAPFVFTAAL